MHKEVRTMETESRELEVVDEGINTEAGVTTCCVDVAKAVR